MPKSSSSFHARACAVIQFCALPAFDDAGTVPTQTTMLLRVFFTLRPLPHTMSPYRAARLFSPQQRRHTFYASFAIRSGTPCLRAASYAAPQAPALVLLLGLTLILVPGRRPAPAHAGAVPLRSALPQLNTVSAFR